MTTSKPAVLFQGKEFGDFVIAKLDIPNAHRHISPAFTYYSSAFANYDATVASYRKTTLTALQQVEDNIAALRILEQEAQQQKDATASVQESLQVFTDRYIGGADPYLQVLTAQTIALQNERTHVDIMRRRMDASVLLIKALRGGWNTSQLPMVAEPPLT